MVTTIEQGGSQKIYIRTMKKDLKDLREADSLKEREKISNIEPAETPVYQKPSFDIEELAPTKNPPQELPEIAKEISANEDVEDLFEVPKKQTPILTPAPEQLVNQIQPRQQITKQPISVKPVAEASTKEHANENEKQKIFLLESQRLDLERQIKNQGGTGQASLSPDNKILVEQKNWQAKLAPLVQEAEKYDEQEKALEAKQAASTDPQEKQTLEKEREALEDKKQDIEKKRWFIEGELLKLENKIKNSSDSNLQYNTQETQLRQEISKIDDSLKAMYSVIQERENIKKMDLETAFIKKPPANLPIEQTPPQPQQKQSTTPIDTEKQYLKNVPVAAKEKLAKSTVIEQQQRNKFMEDVEKWAQEEKKN